MRKWKQGSWWKIRCFHKFQCFKYVVHCTVLILFVQFKKGEKHVCRIVAFSKVAD